MYKPLYQNGEYIEAWVSGEWQVCRVSRCEPWGVVVAYRDDGFWWIGHCTYTNPVI